MNYILDTHVFLWSLFDTKKLSKDTTNIILNIENNIFISVITFFEIALKYNLSKIKLKNIIPEDLPSIAKKTGFDILELRPEVASSFYILPKIKHKDPFNRLIIWQSIQNKMTLISKDSEFEDYKKLGLKIIW